MLSTVLYDRRFWNVNIECNISPQAQRLQASSSEESDHVSGFHRHFLCGCETIVSLTQVSSLFGSRLKTNELNPGCDLLFPPPTIPRLQLGSACTMMATISYTARDAGTVVPPDLAHTL